MTNKKKLVRKGLGRGLDALLANQDSAASVSTPNDDSYEILVKDISTSPFQPRSHFDKDSLHLLAESIKKQGLIQPITVRKLETGKFELISGERRLQATKLAGITKTTAHVLEVKDQQAMEMSLIENIQREDLNAIEIAESYQQIMIVMHLNQEELAERVGKDRATVANYLRLFNLPEPIRESLKSKEISMGHARALLGAKDQVFQMSLFEKVKKATLSVREVEKLVKNEKSSGTKPAVKQTKITYDREKEILEKRFGSKVNVAINAKGKGKVKIPYYTEEELLEIINKLKKN